MRPNITFFESYMTEFHSTRFFNVFVRSSNWVDRDNLDFRLTLSRILQSPHGASRNQEKTVPWARSGQKPSVTLQIESEGSTGESAAGRVSEQGNACMWVGEMAL